MALLLYSTLFRLLLPLFALRMLIRSRNAPAYRQRILERIGISPPLSTKPLWIHAVSVGEVIAISPLVERLLQGQPRTHILITTMTPTGAAQVQQLFGSRVTHRYIPWDTPGSVSRFLDRVAPFAGIIVETELWPNLLHLCANRKVPLMLVNARLSERSCRGYKRFSSLTQIALNSLTHICAQHDADAKRFISLGMPTERVSVEGSIKYDLVLPASAIEQGAHWRVDLGMGRPVLVAASTHQGEDQTILEAWRLAREKQPNLALILVPRHPERFDSVYQLAKGFHLGVTRRSDPRPASFETEIWIGDSLGEMLAYYAAADIAFVGGSFSGTGGHNPLEPAAIGLPIIMGPSRYNFAAICDELEQEGALFQAADAGDLAIKIEQAFAQKERAASAGKRVVERNRGALERMLNRIERTFDLKIEK